MRVAGEAAADPPFRVDAEGHEEGQRGRCAARHAFAQDEVVVFAAKRRAELKAAVEQVQRVRNRAALSDQPTRPIAELQERRIGGNSASRADDQVRNASQPQRRQGDDRGAGRSERVRRHASDATRRAMGEHLGIRGRCEWDELGRCARGGDPRNQRGFG